MIRLRTALTAALLAIPGLAAAAPPPDPRIRTVDYDPSAVVRLQGVFRTATEIVFADEEAILHVALGDATAWDVAAEHNILFVKPKAPHGPTNLIVTTAHGAATRSYAFELTVRPPGPGAVYALRFRYPQDQQAASASAVAAKAAAAERRLVDLELEHAAADGPRNLAYSLQGDAALQPSEVSDNGRFTVLRFPANQPLPTIYEVASTGAEALVPFDVRGGFVVVHQVVRELRLRRGRDVLCIWNDAYDPRGRDPGTGTAAAGVERTDKGVPHD